MPAPATAPRWRSSLVTRLALLWALLLAAVVTLCGVLVYRGSREHLVQVRRESLRHEAERAARTLQEAAAAAAHDLRFLSRAPTVRECIRQQGRPEEERWRTLAEGELRALLEGRLSYAQLRLVGGNGGERELAAFFNRGGFVVKAAPDRKPLPSETEDLRAATACPADELLFAPLRVEAGVQPNANGTPTFRMLTRITADHESVSGVLALDLDLTPHFAELCAAAGEDVHFEVSDAGAGTVLLESHERSLPPTDVSTPPLTDDGWVAADVSGTVRFRSRFELIPSSGWELSLTASLPEARLLAGLDVTRERTIAGTAAAAAIAIALAVLLARGPARRLQRVAAVVTGYDAGQPLGALPIGGDDEVGALAESFRQMAEKVRSQVHALETARQEAEAATRAKEEFLAVISHEIRTPLNTVFGLIRVLERSRPAPHQAPVLASLRASARHLLSLLNDALDYSKFSAGKLDFERADFALGELIGELALTHRPLALQKGLAFDLHLAPDLPAMVQGDSVRLAQILNNLISNALKFTPSGTVTLRVKREQSADAAVERIRFEVEDTGSGISEADQQRVFAPFERVRSDTARRVEGTGLGLHIVRTLVEMQDGEVHLRSRLGEGSCFEVVLPFGKCAAAETISASQTSRTPDFHHWKVLYAEDIASNREVMAAILEDTGAALAFAETGAEALQAIGREGFTLALLDLQLPDMSGLALAEQIRAAAPGLPMLAVTAQCEAQTVEACHAAGIAAVVHKPVEPEKLFQAMVRVVAAELRTDGAARAQNAGATPLDTIFQSDPERHRRVLTSIAAEMRDAIRVLRTAFSTGDDNMIRATRHKLHSAIEQLALTELREAFEAVLAQDPGAQQRCLALLREAATRLETRAAALSAPPSIAAKAPPGATD